ncbi:MAG: hypothetical protein VX627_05905 [Candidatus Thermoplasmatota archaeon]|nr:hypothetical protein [Candidatus Thermoplasmatota archaeon]
MRAIGMVILFCLPLLAGIASAHEPDTFTVIVREDRHEPMQVDVIVNDTVQYYNADNRTNITHIIGLDINGDGDFDDENEFSSGVLHYSCDWTNDSDCRILWKFEINSTDYVGNYILSDLMSDGTETEVYLNIGMDNHAINAPEIGECFGDGCDEDEVDETNLESSSRTSIENAMILGGLFFLLIAMGLASSMIAERQ